MQKDTDSSKIYHTSLHDALPIFELLRADPEKQEVYKGIPHLGHSAEEMVNWTNALCAKERFPCRDLILSGGVNRSEEHTSELQSRLHLVCRLLLQKNI